MPGNRTNIKLTNRQDPKHQIVARSYCHRAKANGLRVQGLKIPRCKQRGLRSLLRFKGQGVQWQDLEFTNT